MLCAPSVRTTPILIASPDFCLRAGRPRIAPQHRARSSPRVPQVLILTLTDLCLPAVRTASRDQAALPPARRCGGGFDRANPKHLRARPSLAPRERRASTRPGQSRRRERYPACSAARPPPCLSVTRPGAASKRRGGERKYATPSFPGRSVNSVWIVRRSGSPYPNSG